MLAAPLTREERVRSGTWHHRALRPLPRPPRACYTSDMKDDTERLDWLDADTGRLQDVYWRIENEGGSARDAIDWFAAHEAREDGME